MKWYGGKAAFLIVVIGPFVLVKGKVGIPARVYIQGDGVCRALVGILQIGAHWEYSPLFHKHGHILIGRLCIDPLSSICKLPGIEVIPALAARKLNPLFARLVP